MQDGWDEPFDPDQPDPVDERDEERISERLSGVIAKFEVEAKRRVDRREPIEQRWIEDLQQYHGVYDPDTEAKLEKVEGSKVFINVTATKTDAMEARLWDLLFPTDDRSWGISPTPVPELMHGTETAEKRIEELEKAAADALKGKQDAEAMMNPEAAQESANVANAAYEELDKVQAEAERLHAVLNEAKARSELMQDEISDQLVQCEYQAEARDMIGWGCKIGQGVLKGPVLNQKVSQRWKQVKTTDQKGNEVAAYELTTEFNTDPAAYSVDPFSFFPDPDVAKLTDSEGFYERHLMTKAQLRKLAKRDDIDEDQIRDLLASEPATAPSYMTQLSDLTGQNSGSVKPLYQVWEYTGPVEASDMLALAEAKGDKAMMDEFADEDPLVEVHAKIWFCDGRALSFALHPLDSGEPIYSVFTIRPDVGSPFGYGIPRIARDPQSILNAAFRMMMDNSALSTGPQVVVDKTQVKPQDGKWNLTPRKVWEWIGDKNTNRPPFSDFVIQSNQAELANIVQIASTMIDEVTAMPAIAQGEQGTDVTKTAQGMALLMNSANVSFRRIVKMYDDDVSVPLIRRFYHWNMQFSDKEEIKGDYEVQARGSSVLLVREMQAQNLLMIALQFGEHPEYGPRLKKGDLLRQIFRAHMIAADEILLTEREFEREKGEAGADPLAQAQMQANEIAAEANQLKKDEMSLKSSMHELEWDKRLEIAQLSYDTAMERLAGQLNMSREQLDQKIGAGAAADAAKERRMAVEVAMQEKTGKSAGGAV